MNKASSLLDNVKVASPCSMSWHKMQGDDRVRFCGQCKLNVYHLSGMKRGEAESLLREHEGRLCVRYFQRADGTVMTKDCPVGLRLARKAGVRMVGLAAAVCVLWVRRGVRGRPRGRGGESRAHYYASCTQPTTGTRFVGEQCPKVLCHHHGGGCGFFACKTCDRALDQGRNQPTFWPKSGQK